MRRTTRLVLLIGPGLTLFIGFVAIPLGMIVYYSLLNHVRVMPFQDPPSFSLDNYYRFFSASSYQFRLLVTSLRMSFAVTVCCLVLGYPLAYVLAKQTRRNLEFVVIFVTLPIWTSYVIRTYSWVSILGENGVLNYLLRSAGLVQGPLSLMYTETAVLIGLVNVYFPFMVLPIYAAIEGIDDALIEAAKNLGASPLRAFREVIVPLSMPGVWAGSALVFIPTLGVYVIPRMLGGTRGTTYGTIITDYFSNIFNWPRGASLMTILLAVVFLLFPLVSKFITFRTVGGTR